MINNLIHPIRKKTGKLSSKSAQMEFCWLDLVPGGKPVLYLLTVPFMVLFLISAFQISSTTSKSRNWKHYSVTNNQERSGGRLPGFKISAVTLAWWHHYLVSNPLLCLTFLLCCMKIIVATSQTDKLISECPKVIINTEKTP